MTEKLNNNLDLFQELETFTKNNLNLIFTQILWTLVCFVPTWLARCWGSTECRPACSQHLMGRRTYRWCIFWALSRAAWWCSPHWGQGWCSCQLWVWWAWSCGLLQTSHQGWGATQMQADLAENFSLRIEREPCLVCLLLQIMWGQLYVTPAKVRIVRVLASAPDK